ncbi:hypothetical protein H9639_05050 [Arthrobacter sp. Sa2CUA1]|uniref:Uncharacterized protein n=1 Tax=Arthrobacter gallicola TaxID=2762225 RepID=A0ABR8UQ28_9MICC|nr:hypothetical protein [Arthrobacter gallicola]MBD7994660.1 hypothetical protein [Arthrobacter gallicola]
MGANRFSLSPILRRHYESMRPPGSKRISFGTSAVLFAIPGIIGTGAIAVNFRLPAAALTPSMAALGVLTGAFLSGFVLLMNTRIKAADDEHMNYRHNLARLIGQTAVTSLYLVIFCVAMIAACISVAIGWELLASLPYGLSVASGLLLAGLVHVALTGATFVRRLFGVYYQLFASDFTPELQSIPPHRPAQRHRNSA